MFSKNQKSSLSIEVYSFIQYQDSNKRITLFSIHFYKDKYSEGKFIKDNLPLDVMQVLDFSQYNNRRRDIYGLNACTFLLHHPNIQWCTCTTLPSQVIVIINTEFFVNLYM